MREFASRPTGSTRRWLCWLRTATLERRTGLGDELRRLDCSLRRLDYLKRYVPPGVPAEDGVIGIIDGEQLAEIRDQSQRAAAAAEQVLSEIEALER